MATIIVIQYYSNSANDAKILAPLDLCTRGWDTRNLTSVVLPNPFTGNRFKGGCSKWQHISALVRALGSVLASVRNHGYSTALENSRKQGGVNMWQEVEEFLLTLGKYSVGATTPFRKKNLPYIHKLHC